MATARKYKNDEQAASQVAEGAVVYWLGIQPKNQKPPQSDIELVELGRAGLKRGALYSLADHIGISRRVLAEEILDISVKTLERKAPNARLDKNISSHAVEISRVLHHAFQVFENIEKVKQWINRENQALNYVKPISLFDTLSGINLVNDVLGRIEEGVYS